MSVTADKLNEAFEYLEDKEDRLLRSLQIVRELSSARRRGPRSARALLSKVYNAASMGLMQDAEAYMDAQDVFDALCEQEGELLDMVPKRGPFVS